MGICLYVSILHSDLEMPHIIELNINLLFSVILSRFINKRIKVNWVKISSFVELCGRTGSICYNSDCHAGQDVSKPSIYVLNESDIQRFTFLEHHSFRLPSCSLLPGKRRTRDLDSH
jgi:hypothetical protein